MAFYRNSPFFDWPKITTSTPHQKWSFLHRFFVWNLMQFWLLYMMVIPNKAYITFKMALNFCVIEPPVSQLIQTVLAYFKILFLVGFFNLFIYKNSFHKKNIRKNLNTENFKSCQFRLILDSVPRNQ